MIYLMEEWFDDKSGTIQKRDIHSDKGGTMRLGAYPCKLEKDTVAYRAYGKETISERHRHRFEFNNAYMEPLKKAGLKNFRHGPVRRTGGNRGNRRSPVVPGMPVPPEFKSRPMTPHPLFRSFIAAA